MALPGDGPYPYRVSGITPEGRAALDADWNRYRFQYYGFANPTAEFLQDWKRHNKRFLRTRRRYTRRAPPGLRRSWDYTRAWQSPWGSRRAWYRRRRWNRWW